MKPVVPPAGYNRELAALFMDQKAEPGPTWRRLVNEYYPRFAAILSIRPGDSSPQIELTPDAWHRAAVLVQYFFAQAEDLLGGIYDDMQANRFESLCRRILAIIRDAGPSGASMSLIHERCGKGTRAKERREILQELESRCLVTSAQIGKQTLYRAV